MWPPKSLGSLVISWKLVSDFLQGLQLVNLAEGLCVCMCACVCVCVRMCVCVWVEVYFQPQSGSFYYLKK